MRNRIIGAAIVTILVAGCVSSSSPNKHNLRRGEVLTAIDHVVTQRKANINAVTRRLLADAIIHSDDAGWVLTGGHHTQAELASLVTTAHRGDIDAFMRDVEIAIVDPAIDISIQRYTDEHDVKLNDDVLSEMREDVREQVKNMAESGAPVTLIRASVESFVRGVFNLFNTKAVASSDYARAKVTLFNRFVYLTIVSKPTGAMVDIERRPIGSTVITEKALLPNRWYQLTFSLNRYETLTKDIYIAAAPEHTTLRADLRLQLRKDEPQKAPSASIPIEPPD